MIDRDDLDALLFSPQKQTGYHFTEDAKHAKQLIFLCVNAIKRGPSDIWVVDNYADLHQKSDNLADELPTLLLTMAKDVKKRAGSEKGTITFYDVLHWIGGNLDSICDKIGIVKMVRR